MRVLVTGATGLIGGAVARRLAQAGHDVIGLSRRASPSFPADMRQFEADLRSPSFMDSVHGAIDPCDAIVHAAASLDFSLDAVDVSLTNCLGTQAIVCLAQRWQVKHVTFMSSISVIGRPRRHPITENHSAAALTAYAASKLYGEHLAAVLQQTCDIPCAALRLTAPVGPGMPRNRIVALFVERARNGLPLQLHGEGTRRQTYVDVRDIAQATESCIEQRVAGIFNIAGTETVSNYELAQRCVALADSASPIEFTGQPDPEEAVTWDVSCEKAHAAFGYCPSYSLDDSIRLLLSETQHRD